MITLKLEAEPVERPAEIPEHRRGPFPGCRRVWVARDGQRSCEGRGLSRKDALADMKPDEERV